MWRKRPYKGRCLASAVGTGSIAALHKSIETLTAENAALKTQLKTSTTETKTAQNEVRALEAKLAAAANTRAIPANASEALREAKMKENLYADFTGLLIRNIKRRDEGDEYDCLQTGRNGSKIPAPFPPKPIF